MKGYNSLLKRQINKCNIDVIDNPDNNLLKILDLINQSYFDFEEEKMLLERSIEISSKEFIESIEAIHKLEAQLIQNEKMAGIGQLSAGIAHEINNPLGFLQSNIETLKKYVTKITNVFELNKSILNNSEILDFEDYKEKCHLVQEFSIQNKIDYILGDLPEIILESADGLMRISKIVNSLLGFARHGGDEKLEEYDLNKAITDTIIIVNNEIKNYAIVEEQLEDIPYIWVYSDEINQVILNLLVNATYAIKSKGENYNEKGIITIHTYCSQNYVYLEIKDTGIGIPQTIMKKIFEPFFTTKPVGSGTGLGLSMTYDIVVNRHHGKIFVESEVGVGTIFKIELPILQKEKNTLSDKNEGRVASENFNS